MTSSPMPALTPALSAVTLLVDDPVVAGEFYQRAFDEPPLWTDEVSTGFGLGSVVLNLLAASDGERLVAPAVVARPADGVRGQLSIWVDDVDTAVALLERRGVTFDQQPVDQPWGMRTATFRDPDGHCWELAQDLGD